MSISCKYHELVIYDLNESLMHSKLSLWNVNNHLRYFCQCTSHRLVERKMSLMNTCQWMCTGLGRKKAAPLKGFFYITSPLGIDHRYLIRVVLHKLQCDIVSCIYLPCEQYSRLGILSLVRLFKLKNMTNFG